MWFCGSVTQTVPAAGGVSSLVAALQQGFSRDLATAAHGMITMLLDPLDVPAPHLGTIASELARLQILPRCSELLLPITTLEGPEIITGEALSGLSYLDWNKGVRSGYQKSTLCVFVS